MLKQEIDSFRELFEDMAREYRRLQPALMPCACGFLIGFVLILIGSTTRELQELGYGPAWLLTIVGMLSMLAALVTVLRGIIRFLLHVEKQIPN